MLRRLAALFALLSLGVVDAQAAERPFPSLAKRPGESRDQAAPPAPAPIEAAPSDPALVAEVAGLADKAAAADSAFQTQLPAGRQTVASAAQVAQPAGESWVAAQMAISRLDAARYDSVVALAGLDTLHVERLADEDAARATAAVATIDPARERVLAMVDAQNDALDRLRTSLTTP